MTLTKDDIIKALEGMKITELNDLVKAIEEHFGVVAAAAVGAAPAAAVATDEGPSEVDVIITEVGTSRIAVIKLVSTITGENLMAAKKLLDEKNPVIKSKVKIEDAEKLKDQLVEAGASVELK